MRRLLINRNSSSLCVVVLLASTFSRYSQRGGWGMLIDYPSISERGKRSSVCWQHSWYIAHYWDIDWVAIFFGVVGSVGLIILSIVSPLQRQRACSWQTVWYFQPQYRSLVYDFGVCRRSRHLCHLPICRDCTSTRKRRWVQLTNSGPCTKIILIESPSWGIPLSNLLLSVLQSSALSHSVSPTVS